MEMFDGINEYLNDLETQLACEIEANNIDYSAMEVLKYKNHINLN